MQHLSGAFRYFLLFLTVAAISAGYLLLPVPKRNSAPEQGSYDTYSRLLTAAKDGRSTEPYTLELPEITPAPCSVRVEAENAGLPLPESGAYQRTDYSGNGYLAGVPAQTRSALTFHVSVPQTQHYAVTLCLASDCTGTHTLRIGDKVNSQFLLESTGSFVRITFHRIFLMQGETEISVDTGNSTLDSDYLELTDDNAAEDDSAVPAEALCDPSASPNAQKLYETMCGFWGEKMLTGQYVSGSSNQELDDILAITGQLPAIRFSALGSSNDRRTVNDAADWHQYLGGIVGLMWQWNAPGTDSVYTEDAGFDLHAALRDQEAAALAMRSPEEAAADDSIPAEAVQLLTDIDRMAETLRPLAQMDIPVLWRPLHEAGGGWYWWGGAGRSSYLKLWDLLYTRLTAYHNIHNLIWIWNGQSAGYLVPESQYDIAAVDVYLQPEIDFGSRYEQFHSLRHLTGGGKLLALSECSAVPDPEMIRIDSAVWSFFGLWYGEYLPSPDAQDGSANYSSNDLYNLYNCEFALSLNDFLSYC